MASRTLAVGSLTNPLDPNYPKSKFLKHSWYQMIIDAGVSLQPPAKIWILKIIFDEHCSWFLVYQSNGSISRGCIPLDSQSWYFVRSKPKKPTITGLLDIRKVLDSIWQYGVVHNLNNILNFHLLVCKLIFSFPGGRQSQEKIQQCLSLPGTSHIWFPQADSTHTVKRQCFAYNRRSRN